LELDYAEECRALGGPYTDDYREGVSLVLSDQLEEAHEALVTNNWKKIEKDADALIKAAGLPPLDHDSADFGRLCRRLLQAQIEYTKIEADRWQGIYTPRRPDAAASAALVNGTPRAQPKTQPPPAPTGPLFTESIEGYLRENPRAERSARQLKSELQREKEVCMRLALIVPAVLTIGILFGCAEGTSSQSRPPGAPGSDPAYD